MKRMFETAILAGLVLLAGSCTSIPSRIYAGAPLAKEMAVHIRGTMQKGSLMPLLETVDNIAGTDTYWTHFSGQPHFNSAWDGSFQIEVGPGDHSLVCRTMYFSGGRAYWNKNPQTITFTAEPGKTYYLNAYRDETKVPVTMMCKIEDALFLEPPVK